MRNKLLDAGEIPWTQVENITTELMEIYYGQAYTYMLANVRRIGYINGMTPHYEWDKVDLIICNDKINVDEFTQSEIDVMCSQGEGILFGRNIAKRDKFS